MQCDLKRPSCSQCIRAGKGCYGYRDPLSMMFKNESDVVAKKAEQRYERLAMGKVSSLTKRAVAVPSGNQVITSSTIIKYIPLTNEQANPKFYTRYPSPESIASPLIPSIEDQAQGFFISNYISQPSIVPRGQFEWVTEMLTQSNVEDILRCSIRAVSLAGFANATKNRGIMQQAQIAYMSALRSTNNALGVKETAIKDSTLVSVIMLGLYENFVMEDKRSIQAWARHVDGACALIKLRGQDQFKSDIGRRVFHQFYGTALLVALASERPVHAGMKELYEAMTPSSDYTVHGREYTTRLIEIIHRTINLNQDRRTDPATIVATALQIDRDLDSIKEIMPYVWRYDTIHLRQPSEHHFGTTYHVYIDPWIAQMWNNLNTSRIYLYKIVQENLARSWTQYDPPLYSQNEYNSFKARANEVIVTTTAAILASVPQIVGMIPFPDLRTAKRRALDPRPDESALMCKLQPPGTYLNAAQSTHMHHLIWVLYTVGQNDLVSSAMRQWVIDILLFVALRIGTLQAVILADELKALQQARSPYQSLHMNMVVGR